MTYSHALRYLTTPDRVETAHATLGTPLIPVKPPHAPMLLCFTRNKLGSAAASLTASVLKQAGISYLHWIDDDLLDAKCRFLLDGRPIPPPLLARHASDWQAAARADGREDVRAERCAGVLSLCAAEADCRVILLESPVSVCHVGYFHALNRRVKAFSLLSDGREVARTAQNPATVEIITPAYGRTMHSQITDICARNDCKMVTIAATAVQREDVTLGGQTVVHTDKTGIRRYRLSSASHIAAEAAAIALYCLHSLNERGLSIREDALAPGLLSAALCHCGSVYSATPLILTHAANNTQELTQILADVRAMQASLSSPLTVWLEPCISSLPADMLLYEGQEWPGQDTPSLLLIGSPAWIEEKLSARKRKKGKNTDKI